MTGILDSPSRVRFIRCILVVTEECNEIMQQLLQESKIPPEALFQRINRDEQFTKKNLTLTDMQRIKDLSTDGYKALDITIVYKIIKHYNTFINPPTRGWGQSPCVTEITIGDDAERIRIERNKLFHMVKGEISEEEFTHFFTNMIGVGIRVDAYLNLQGINSFEQRIRQYQTEPIDEAKAAKIQNQCTEFKEYFEVDIGQKQLKVFQSKQREAFTEEQSQADGNDSTQFIAYFSTVENRERVVDFLESLKDVINQKSLKIKLVSAEIGSLILHLMVHNSLLYDDEDLKDELRMFFKNMFQCENIRSSFSRITTVVMTVTDIKGCLYPTENLNNQNITSLREDGPMVLKLKVQNEVLQSDESFQEQLTDFFKNVLSKSNEENIFKQTEFKTFLEPDIHGGLYSKENSNNQECTAIQDEGGSLLLKKEILQSGESFQDHKTEVLEDIVSKTNQKQINGIFQGHCRAEMGKGQSHITKLSDADNDKNVMNGIRKLVEIRN